MSLKLAFERLQGLMPEAITSQSVSIWEDSGGNTNIVEGVIALALEKRQSMCRRPYQHV